MHRTKVLLSTFSLLLSTAGALGCSSSSTSASPGTGGDVSFQKDVIPLFWKGANKDTASPNVTKVEDGSSCTLTSSCHGQTNNSGELNFYLGDPNTPSTSADIYKLLVNVKSVEDPKMNFVTPGDPANSYIIYKMKGTQTKLANDCMSAAVTCSNCTPDMPCGAFMPYNGIALPDDYIQVVSDWIAQGAKDN